MLRLGLRLHKRRKLEPAIQLLERHSRSFGAKKNGFLHLQFDNLPQSVRIVEVGPRDGLQNEQQKIPTDVKVRLIDMLTEAGLPAVEITSFVSPKAVPQLADAADVVNSIQQRQGVRYPVLVPNMKGFERALQNGVKEIAVFGAATETFSHKNIGCSMRESMDRFAAVTQRALEEGMEVRGYISCVLGCPYEGAVDFSKVAEMACRLRDMGCYEVSLGDTIGVGTPPSLYKLLKECRRQGISTQQLAVHLHDTYGQAVANLTLALQMGVSVFDSSVAGLGGCPFAPGATGNVATEDCLYLLDGLGVEHGVDRAKLQEASTFILAALGKGSNSRAGRARAAAAAKESAGAAGSSKE